ncbi:MAG: bifunctional 5,10-methylenetetrahydrofolate dehydrogenase/5,10-methenyltetrahydrofolate cyclohydrolase [Dehalococcoidia bacterium]|nr:bifunctional 5,10-methylenetetrahydrofolate dehydrogenase/5,10-methenyltetrahydrofolate cyclohydrolase [Dehalococcoidia bacterium]
MSANIIDGAKIAADVRAEVGEDVKAFSQQHDFVPHLAVVLVGEDPASRVYVRNKHRAAAEAGMTTSDVTMPASTTQGDLIAEVRRLGDDPNVHGILVQLPLPDHLDQYPVIETIDPLKDVDALHPFNVGLLSQGRERFAPATPAGIREMLLRDGHDPAGKHVVVVGRSEIVGKPVASILMQKQSGADATVTVCHSRTTDMPSITRQADILIAAIGRPHYITSDMVKDDAVIIDVGINRIDAPERKRGYRLVGDVDFDAVSEKAAAITPVPGGVGPMTIAMLLRNTLKAAKLAVSGA